MNSPARSTPRSRATPRRAAEQGYSLVELLISLVLMGLIFGGLYTILFQSQTTFEAQQASMALRQQARVAINNIVPEIRMAGFGMENLTELIADARIDRIAFVADIDNGNPAPPCSAAFEGSGNRADRWASS